MFSQIARTARLGGYRVARQQAVSARRTFVVSSIRQADLVQDMYLKELKSYKVPQTKASDAEAHVLKFKQPATPRSPEEGDLASDLKSYETAQVEVEGQSSSGESSEAAPSWFEEEEDFEDDAPAHH